MTTAVGSATDAATPGALDGLTILRFARAFEHGGGVEGHLADLNKVLGARNRVTTVQIQLTADHDRTARSEHRVGTSRLVLVPLQVVPLSAHAGGEPTSPGWRGRAVHALLAACLPTARLNALAMRLIAPWRPVPRRAGDVPAAGETAAALIREFAVDLVVLHACEGRDTADIITVAAAAGVPVVLVHHFSNPRLGTLSARQQVARADGVGGASAVAVPAYLRQAFTNLSDAVDVDFYDRRRVRSAPPLPTPYIFAPGRLTPEKGQFDVLAVMERLRSRGVDATVVFAGRADSSAFEERLRHHVSARGLSDSVTFLGELTLEQYRDSYAGAAVMLMPTYHAEGMPRTVIESQAMQVPPIAYDVGGMREGVRHLETGYLVSRGDIDGMADATARLLTQPQARAAMGEAGRAFVQKDFTLHALAERHERFYTAALQRHRRTHRRGGSGPRT